MSTVWDRVRQLKGLQLRTQAQGKVFEILDVTHDRVIFSPRDGKGTQRWWPRKDIEYVYQVRIERGRQLEPTDIRDLWPQDQNTSYIPVIINEIYRLDND